jgi:hypothetical protein
LVRGDFSDWSGWQFRNEWAKSSYAAELQPKRWKGQPGSLAVLGEQGIGDEIMFASCIPDAKKLAEVAVECDPRLQGVFERSLGVKTRPRADIIDRDSSRYLTLERPEDWFLPMGDLPRLFRRARSDFPAKAYLTPLPEYVEKWGRLKGRTGVAWRSRTGQTQPEAFGVQDAVCVQYDSWSFETEGMYVPDCDLKNDIEDLLGICANLARVVSVPQTIVHIAGAIGTPVDVVMAPRGSSRVENAIPYRYTTPRMFWYPNVNVYGSIQEYRNR